MSKVSVLIPCFNSERHIESTLRSVKWADEILAVDSFSSDGTLEICKKYDARILQHEYVNSATQKNWAIPQCSHDWVLIVDTDEVLEPGLKEEILARLSGGGAVVAYRIPRKNLVYGKWLSHGGLYPDYQIRLFKKDAARYHPREVHAHMDVRGPVGTLDHHLIHDGFKNLSVWTIKTERYTNYETAEYLKRGSRPSFLRLIIIPWFIFIRNYFIAAGFLDGYRGFLIAALEAWSYFITQAKVRERFNVGS